MSEEFAQHTKNLKGNSCDSCQHSCQHSCHNSCHSFLSFLTDGKKAQEAKKAAEDEDDDDIGPWLKGLRQWANHLDPDEDMAKRYRMFILDTRWPDRK